MVISELRLHAYAIKENQFAKAYFERLVGACLGSVTQCEFFEVELRFYIESLLQRKYVLFDSFAEFSTGVVAEPAVATIHLTNFNLGN